MIDRPELLTGTGHEAPTPAVLRFIGELVAAGATTVVKPACPRCHGVKALSKLLDGKRICRACFAKHAAVPCARCGAVREPATRDAAGRPLGPNCLIRDPVNLEVCVGCGRRQPVAVRLADGVRCNNCRPKEIRECGHCGRTAPCELSRATGQPWCERCQQRWATCSDCNTVAQARGGTWEEPLCAKCTNPDPDFWGRCPTCETTWQLSPRPCQRCVLDQKIRDLIGDGIGAVAPELAAFHAALTDAERPDVALAWISRAKAPDLLERIGRDERPVTHDLLDELPPGKVLAHLRSILVATGALPPRDERLVALEKWITTTVQARTSLAERRILHGYAVWHHLRRLRSRIGEQHTTQLQDMNVRCHVTAADNFLAWLAGEGLTLGACTQADLERWMTDPAFRYRDETGHFARWSVQHRHAHGLTCGTVRWTGPQGTIDSEKRWSDARRLLNDDTLPTTDRVAGLLLILYAQKISTISQLTVQDVDTTGETVAITFGTSPVILPMPLGALVRELLATRRGKAKIGTPDDAPWLFPGGQPGRPLSDSQVGLRLHKIGIRPQRDRSTALFTLAAELPAAILARMLSIHIQVAVQWQKASAGDWAAYAADVSRRSRREITEVNEGFQPPDPSPSGTPSRGCQ